MNKALIGRGDACRRRHKFDAALADYEKASSLEIDQIGNLRAAELHLRMDSPQKALAKVRQVVKVLPESATAIRIRGEVYGSLGQFDKADADLQAALKIEPENADVWIALGVMNARKQEFQQALQNFEQALKCDPTSSRALHYRGFHRFQIDHDLTGAIADFTKAIEYDPWDQDSYQNRGAVYQDQGDERQALKDYEMAASLRELAK